MHDVSGGAGGGVCAARVTGAVRHKLNSFLTAHSDQKRGMATVSKWPSGRVGTFKETHTFEDRRTESSRILSKFPGRVPVVVERAAKSIIPPIDKAKFLVPADLTVGQLIYVIRHRLTLPPEMALYVFVDGIMPTTGTSMREVYHAHKDADGFLYMLYAGESTFGGSRQRALLAVCNKRALSHASATSRASACGRAGSCQNLHRDSRRNLRQGRHGTPSRKRQA